MPGWLKLKSRNISWIECWDLPIWNHRPKNNHARLKSRLKWESHYSITIKRKSKTISINVSLPKNNNLDSDSWILITNLVTSTVRTAEITMANLTHISFSVVESQTFWPQTGVTWALETFLAFPNLIFFLQKLCLRLNFIKIDLQILGQNSNLCKKK